MTGLVIDGHQILGQKSKAILLPPGRLKHAETGMVPDSVPRFMTSTLRQGSFLVSTLRKPGPR
jgi:hypothetical protein